MQTPIRRPCYDVIRLIRENIMATLTMRIDDRMENELASLAEATHRTKSQLATRGLCADLSESALAGHAECFVTGDNARLELGRVAGLPILSPPAILGKTPRLSTDRFPINALSQPWT
jgi:hypothetical protein